MQDDQENWPKHPFADRHEDLDARTILFVIERSKNKNLVAYEVNLDADTGKIDTERPVIPFWLKIDPAYVAKRRAQGYETDRVDLTWLESTAAYGISVSPLDETKEEFSANFVALPSREARLERDPETGQPRIVGTVSGHDCRLESLWVESRERWIGLPQVLWVELRGRILDGERKGELVAEKIQV